MKILKNTFKTEVTDNGGTCIVTFVTFEGDIDNHKIKHLLNVREIILIEMKGCKFHI